MKKLSDKQLLNWHPYNQQILAEDDAKKMLNVLKSNEGKKKGINKMKSIGTCFSVVLLLIFLFLLFIYPQVW